MSATAATLQPPITRVQARGARLPYGWPLYVAFGLFPVWYLLGFGSLVWFMLAVPMTFNLVAANYTGVAISYAIGQSAPMVAALWGVLVWKEFKGAPGKAYGYLAMMFLFYVLAILLVSRANTAG